MAWEFRTYKTEIFHRKEGSGFGHGEGRSVPPGTLFNHASDERLSSGTIDHGSSLDYAYPPRCEASSASQLLARHRRAANVGNAYRPMQSQQNGAF